jgi:3-hydroxybutyryl-CoA dehydrogenase
MTATAVIRRVGVVGAGTMGSGIAQIGACAGIDTMLYDPVDGAAARGAEQIGAALRRSAQRGRLAPADAASALARLRTTQRLDDLFGCDLVIEAAPEKLAIKRSIFATLDGGCAPGALLATNTSSIPVTAIASAARHSERVIGLHFFNPVARMRLAEVIPAAQTGAAAVAATVAAAEQLGKQPIVAADVPGFLVNRCGRPFYGEALRIVTERLATPAQVDRICRMAGGFRMGPFELMDLVGIDVGLAVMQSFATGSFGEPRWRPSPLQARLVAAGRLGRKSGRGWYDYGDAAYRDEDPAPPPAAGRGLALRIAGAGPVATHLRARAEQAGATLVEDPAAPVLLADDAAGAPAAGASLRLRSCASASLVGHGDPSAVGFSLPTGPSAGRLVELGATRICSRADIGAAQRILAALGLHVERVGDGPGLVMRRLLAQIVNEACFAVGEGIGSPADVDAGVTLGLNYPQGPMAWGAALGFDGVLATLDALWDERREERFRPAPLLREAALTGIVDDA